MSRDLRRPVFMPGRREGRVSGNQKASASTFFTLNGIRPEAEGEAITDTDTAVKALSVAGELPRKRGLLVEVSRIL